MGQRQRKRPGRKRQEVDRRGLAVRRQPNPDGGQGNLDRGPGQPERNRTAGHADAARHMDRGLRVGTALVLPGVTAVVVSSLGRRQFAPNVRCRTDLDRERGQGDDEKRRTAEADHRPTTSPS